MRSRVAYVPGSGGEAVQLDGGGALIGTAPALRSREWTRTLGYRWVTGVSRDAREVAVEAHFTDPAAADALRRAADRDVYDGTPGEIVVDGEWRQSALILACDAGTIYRGYHSATLTIALLDGAWRRRRSLSLAAVPDDPAPGEEWLDLPFDAPIDLKERPVGAARLDNASVFDAEVRVTFHGPVTAPSVQIGGNVYRSSATVPPGARLVIDGASFPRSARLVLADGSESDAFATVGRSGGRGSGSYGFQPVPPGGSAVSWSGRHALDIEWYEEEGEPPWSL